MFTCAEGVQLILQRRGVGDELHGVRRQRDHIDVGGVRWPAAGARSSALAWMMPTILSGWSRHSGMRE